MELDLVTTHDSHHYHTRHEPSCPTDGGMVIYENAIAMKVEHFHQRKKVITLNNLVSSFMHHSHVSKMTSAA